MPELCMKDVAKDFFAASSSEVEAVLGAGTGSLFMKGFLFDRSIAGVTNSVSLMIQKPLFWGTTMKHLKRKEKR